MNLRHGWWMACALLCGSAMVVQRARADPTWPALPVSPPAPAAVSSVGDALAEAEALYRSARFDEAGAAFSRIVATDRLNAQAWLRLGNLHHRAQRLDEALEAYRQASLTVPGTAAENDARARALLNIALLHVAHASRAIDELDAAGSAGSGPLRAAREDTARQVGAQRYRVDRAITSVSSAASSVVASTVGPPSAAASPPSAPSPSTSASTSASPAASPAAPTAASRAPSRQIRDASVRATAPPPPAAAETSRGAPHDADRAPSGPDATDAADATSNGPYTVDRWAARPRRVVAPRPAARASLRDPVTEDPLPAPPAVEVIRGAVAGRQP